MIASVILNACTVLFVLVSILVDLRRAESAAKLFRYFTTLSNVLCAIASLTVLVFQLLGGLPFGVLLFKYIGTAAVTVTMLTVFLFLLPVSHDWKGLLTGPELFLHFICPALAILSFLAFEKTAMPAWIIALGVAPVVLYGALYLRKVVFAPEASRWEDFYGFNYNGKWKRSLVLMMLGAALISLALWAI